MKLVIFDLDQTLVDVFQTHDRAVALAFEEFFGKSGVSLEQIDYAGRRQATDERGCRGSFLENMAAAGPAVQAGLPPSRPV